jgi:hypothetical protein
MLDTVASYNMRKKKLDKNRTLLSSRRLRLAERGHVSLTLIVPEQAREPLRLLAQRLRAGDGLSDALSALLPEKVPAPLQAEQGAVVGSSAFLDETGTETGTETSAEQRDDTARIDAEISRLKDVLDRTQAECREADARAQAQSRRADELLEKLDRAQAALMQSRNAAREDRHYLIDIRTLPGWLRWWVERYR